MGEKKYQVNIQEKYERLPDGTLRFTVQISGYIHASTASTAITRLEELFKEGGKEIILDLSDAELVLSAVVELVFFEGVAKLQEKGCCVKLDWG